MLPVRIEEKRWRLEMFFIKNDEQSPERRPAEPYIPGPLFSPPFVKGMALGAMAPVAAMAIHFASGCAGMSVLKSYTCHPADYQRHPTHIEQTTVSSTAGPFTGLDVESLPWLDLTMRSS
jgi:hypothetical protein